MPHLAAMTCDDARSELVNHCMHYSTVVDLQVRHGEVAPRHTDLPVNRHCP